MNYRNADEERIRKQRELQEQNRQKVAQQKNLENKTYSGKSLDALAKGQYSSLRNNTTNKVPELKPSTKYNNQNVVANQPQKSTRDTRFDNDFDNFFNYRYGDFSGEVDYDPVTDTDVESWRNVKKDIMRKNKWSDKEFEDKFKAYSDERYKKMGDEIIASSVETAKKHPFLGTLQQAILNPGVWLEGAANMVSGLPFVPDKYKAQSADDPMFLSSRQKEAIKQTVKDEHIKSNVGKGAYDIGTGLADMVMSAGVPVLGAATLGTETASRNQRQALERGADPNKAALTGLATGVVSGAMNKVGLDKALASNTIRGAMNKEGLENILEDVATLGIDKAINKNKSQLNAMHDYYASQGMDDQSAWTQVIKDTGLDLATSYGTGAAFGGVMSGLNRLPSLLGGRNNTPDIPDNNVPAVTGDATIDNAIKQTADAEAEIQRLSEQIPKVTEVASESAPTLTPEEQAALQTELANEGFDWSEGQANTPNNVESFNGYKVGDKVTYSTDDFDGKSSTESTIKEVYPDHVIVDVPGLSDHVYIDNDMMDMLSPSKGKPIEVDPNDVIYHAGTLSRLNKADSAGKMEGMRGTGYYGTGHYFVDGAHKGEIGKDTSYGNKPYSSVDISKYNNLFKADTDAKASKLHDFSQKMMRYINGYNDRYFTDSEGIVPEDLKEYMDDMYSNYKNLFGDKAMSQEEFETRLNDFRNNYDFNEEDRGDSAFTTFMKEHGYNGVDTRGTRSADTERGVVIYDLDEDSVLQSNVTDTDVKNGLMNTRVRNGQPVFDAATDEKIQKSLDDYAKKQQIKQEYNRLYNEANLRQIESDIQSTKERIKNLEENVIPYEENMLEGGEEFQKEVDRTFRDFKKFDPDVTREDIESLLRNNELDRNEDLENSRKELNNLKQELSEMQTAYDNEFKASEEAYRQAKENVDKADNSRGLEAQRKSRHYKAKYSDPDGKVYLPKEYNEDYYHSGKRGNINRKDAFDSGKTIIIGDRNELRDFLFGNNEKYAETAAYGKVSNKLADKIYNTNNKIKPYNYFLEVEKGHDIHAVDHMTPSEPGDLPLSEDEIIDALERVNDADVVYAKTYPNGENRIKLKLDNADGRIVIVEMASKSTGALKLISGWKNDWAKINSKNNKSSTSTAGGNNATPFPARLQTAPNQNVPQNSGNVNTSSASISQRYETLKKSDLFTKSEANMKMLETGKKQGVFDKDVENRKQTQEEALNDYLNNKEEVTKRNLERQWDSGKDVDTSMLILNDVLNEGDQAKVNLTLLKQAEQSKGAGRILRANRDYVGTKEGTIQKAGEYLNEKADRVLSSKKTKNQFENMAERVVKGDLSELSSKLNMDEANIDNIRKAVKAGAGQSDIVKMIGMYQAVGKTGISPEALKKISDIYDEIQNKKLNPNSKKRADLEADAFKVLADDIGSKRTWKEQWDAWRYLAMLGNPKTHLRNVLGNATHYAVTEAKDNIGAVLEGAVDKVSKNGIDRTKSILTSADKNLVDMAAKDADDVAYSALNDGKNKYNVKEEIDRARNTFNSKVLSKIDDLNSNALDVEDYTALKRKYSKSLARYLKANGADASIFNKTDENSSALLDKARAYAIDQAKQATFHEYSKMAERLNQFSKGLREGNAAEKVAGMAVEGLVPFKKTPINILKQGFKYSPVSLAKAVGKTIDAIRTGNSSASDAIEDLAAGMTGTMVMALGGFLAHQGFLTGGANENYDVDNAETEQGAQNYAIKIGNNSYTLDWLAPVSLPLFVGAELYNMSAKDKGEDEDNIDKFVTALSTIAEPVTEMSMLQGIQNMLNELSYSKENVFGTIAANTTLGYASQGIPTLAGQVARAIDPTRRSTYSDQKVGVKRQFDKALTKTKNKIPFLTQSQQPYVNASGEEQINDGLFSTMFGDNIGTRLADQMLSPGYFKKGTVTKVDEELNRLYEATGENVYKNVSSGKIKDERLSKEDFTKYQKLYGSNNDKLYNAIVGSSDYNKLDDAERVKTISNIKNISKMIADHEIGGKELEKSQQKIYDIYKTKGIDGITQYIRDKANADALGIKYDTYMKKESEQPGSAAQYAQDKQKLDAINDKYGTNIQMSTLEKYGVDGAEQRAQGSIDAKNYGFVDKDGNANVDAYTKAVDMFGNDQKSLRAYSDFRKQGLKKNAQMIPALMNNNQFTDKQKGQVIMAEHGYKYDDLGNTAKGAYDREGEAGVYYFYLLKNLADTQYGDGNGSVKKAEKVALMNSDNPNVTKLSDDMYYYLGNAKW